MELLELHDFNINLPHIKPFNQSLKLAIPCKKTNPILLPTLKGKNDVS
jgi:hypothetical protein